MLLQLKGEGRFDRRRKKLRRIRQVNHINWGRAVSTYDLCPWTLSNWGRYRHRKSVCRPQEL